MKNKNLEKSGIVRGCARPAAMIFISITLLGLTACGKPPQVPAAQVQLVEATVTAVAGKDLKSLELIITDVDKAFQNKVLTSKQRDQFVQIHTEAKAQRWKQAESAAYDFLFAQGP